MGTIDLNDYVAFEAVAEHGGFSAAAQRLQLPKSSVSRAIGALERELGVRLFHRTTRRVALTNAGVELRSRIAEPLGSLQRAGEDLPERDESPSGLLRVTTLSDIANELVADVTATLTARHPRLQVDLVLTERPLDLVAERIDVAVRLAPSSLRDSSLSGRRVGRVRFALYASPSYLERRGTPRRPQQLAEHDWVTLLGARSLTATGLDRKLVPRIRCNDGDALRSVLRRGGGVGILPTFLAERDVKRHQLARILPRWTLLTGDMWLLYPSARQIPRKVIAFRDELIKELKARPLLSL